MLAYCRVLSWNPTQKPALRSRGLTVSRRIKQFCLLIPHRVNSTERGFPTPLKTWGDSRFFWPFLGNRQALVVIRMPSLWRG